MLSNACENNEDETFVIDLLSLMEQSSTLQLQVLKNLVGKMKSGVNHKYTDIIKDIAGFHKNRLGQTNYSLLQHLLGLPGKTTASLHAETEKISIGMNNRVYKTAMTFYE